MNQKTLLRSTDYKRAAWKNGLGWTDQIRISPENADLRRGDFNWRISSARIERSSDFSPFPEHDRVLVVIEGEGITLTHTFEEGSPPDTVELPALEPYEFPGDIPTRCELRGGAIRDLSVFARKGVVSAEVETASLSEAEPYEWNTDAGVSLIFVARGAIALESGERINEGESLLIEQSQAAENSERLSTASEATVVLVRIR